MKFFIEETVDDNNPIFIYIKKLGVEYQRIKTEEIVPLLFSKSKDETIILRSIKEKRYLKDCPGTKFYRCCDYKVLQIGDNCPFECIYCILNSYFDNLVNIIYVDVDKMVDEIIDFLSKNRFLRLGTGEFTDSLALEPYTNLTKILLDKLKEKSIAWDRFNLELKTKSLNIENFLDFEYKKSLLFSWSLNTFFVWKNLELKTPSPEERLKKAKLAVDNGFKVSFHFDPLIVYDEYKKDYKEIIELIFDYIDPNKIAFISLGSFRYIPYLKHFISKKYGDTFLLENEFIYGKDSKLRYPYKLRVELYKYIISLLDPFKKNITIYYCMESERVWRNTLGYYPESNFSLGKILWESIKK